jgi:acetyltransferase
LYFRFFGITPNVDHEFLSRFTHIDYDREMAIIAVLEENGKQHMAGVVRVVADAWGESAEFAILVADKYQNRGLGSRMTDYMLEIARDQGLRTIYATVLRTNSNMVRMFKERGFKLKLEKDSSAYTAELNLESSIPFARELPFQPI